jgi:AbiV family abortive infection protein
LFDNGRFERSVALAILAIEEAGKSSIIRSILLTDDQKELKKEWQNYRKHTEKNLTCILPELATKGARQLEDLRPICDREKDHGQILDNLKQLSFYTDIFSKRKWSIPSEAINKELAEGILQVAKITAKEKSDGLNSEEGLNLWVKHINPVWKQEMTKMKQALINCYNEAEELGITEEGKANEMVKFLL